MGGIGGSWWGCLWGGGGCDYLIYLSVLMANFVCLQIYSKICNTLDYLGLAPELVKNKEHTEGPLNPLFCAA